MSEDYGSRAENPTRMLPVVSPANMLPVQVVARDVVAPDVVSVSIVLPGTEQSPAPYLPGQFVTLALPTPKETLYRSYSLCGAGDARQPWQIAVKRMDQGAVSTYFYTWVREGTLLYASLPRGTFSLPPDLGPETTLVFVAAGSGITPIMGMLRALDKLPPNEAPLAQLHYASRSTQDIIFGDELAEMDPGGHWLSQRHYLSSEKNRMTAEAILARTGSMGARAHWYMCGPEQLKRDLTHHLTRRGVPESYIHSEIFATKSGPAYRVEARGGSSVGGSLMVEETGATLDVKPEETLLTALERHGYKPNFSCRAGACGECKLKVTSGQVDPVGEALSTSERKDGYVLGCLAHPIGEVTIVSGGRPPAGVSRVPGFVPGAGSSSSGRTLVATSFTRVATLVSASALLLGAWNLTNHRPLAWMVASAAYNTTSNSPAATSGSGGTAQPGSTTTASGGNGGGSSTATAGGGGGNGGGGGAAPTATRGTGGGGGAPTPTTAPSGGGGGGAAPTATPVPPPPTPTPAPKATSTPSPGA
jgi:ring-1,2-phenylacetyl-CoA epoxidase subunit PaaE